MSGWLAMHRGEETDLLQARHPTAFLLLCQVARRARWRREPCTITGLHFGQAMVGDWKAAGLDSEKAYRHAKGVLERAGLVAFKGANKGTIATLVSKGIFSLETEDKGEQTGDPSDCVKGERRGRPGATKNKDTRKQEERESARDALVENLLSLRPEWSAVSVLSDPERDAFERNRRVFASIMPDTWDAMRRFMATRFPDGDARFQPRQRLLAIRAIGDIAAQAEAWVNGAGKASAPAAKPWPESFEQWARENYPSTPARALWLAPKMRELWEESEKPSDESPIVQSVAPSNGRTIHAGHRHATETIIK